MTNQIILPIDIIGCEYYMPLYSAFTTAAQLPNVLKATNVPTTFQLLEKGHFQNIISLGVKSVQSYLWNLNNTENITLNTVFQVIEPKTIIKSNQNYSEVSTVINVNFDFIEHAKVCNNYWNLNVEVETTNPITGNYNYLPQLENKVLVICSEEIFSSFIELENTMAIPGENTLMFNITTDFYNEFGFRKYHAVNHSSFEMLPAIDKCNISDNNLLFDRLPISCSNFGNLT